MDTGLTINVVKPTNANPNSKLPVVVVRELAIHETNAALISLTHLLVVFRRSVCIMQRFFLYLTRSYRWLRDWWYRYVSLNKQISQFRS